MESKKESVDIRICQPRASTNDERAEAPKPQIYTQETQLEIGDDTDDDDVYALPLRLLKLPSFRIICKRY